MKGYGAVSWWPHKRVKFRYYLLSFSVNAFVVVLVVLFVVVVVCL